jgi:hypothetical protein
VPNSEGAATSRLPRPLILACSIVAPLCLAVFPALSLFAQNQTDVAVSVLWPPLVASAGVTLALYGLFLLLTRRAAKAGALTSLAVAFVLYFGILHDNLSLGLSDRAFLVLWAALFAAAAWLVVRRGRELLGVTLIAAVGAAVLAIPAAVRVASYQSAHPAISLSNPRLWPSALPAPRPAAGAARPDIYVLIPDDYARPDVLRRILHYDDSAFLAALQSRGFVVSPDARSPYSDSESNTAAELNLDYINQLPKILGAKSEDVRPVKRLAQDNRAAALLKPLGYHYSHIDTDEVTFGGSNPAISPLAPPDSFANLWMQKSVLRLLGGPLGFSKAAINERFRDSIQSQFRALEDTTRRPGPKFVVFHTLLPHDPYVYSDTGAPVTFPGHTDADPGSKLGMPYYVRQLKYLNGKLLNAIDAIRSNSSTPPVIVLMSDEGFQADPGTTGEAVATDIRVKGMLALSLPGADRHAGVRPPNTVNALRYVFNRSFGTHYPMLRSASYPEGDLPYQFEEMRVR